MKNTIKIVLLLTFSLTGSLNIFAQITTTPTVQDCLGAIPICQDYYVEPTPYQFFDSNGNYEDEIYRSLDCHTGEGNGMWYIFTAQSTGMLRFEINADNIYTDYDWIVFDMTDANCSILGTPSMSNYMISSNTYGGTREEPEGYILNPTGANSQHSGGNAGNCNGPGPTNGPKWNDDIPVFEGRTYVLYISNWENSNLGYSIDFSASSASIYDNKRPYVSNIEAPTACNSGEIRIKFSENILCNSIDIEDFIITSSSGVIIPLASVISETCSIGAQFGREFILTTTTELFPDYYTISINPHTSLSLIDLCENSSIPSIFTFTKEGINPAYTVTPISCSGKQDATITFSTSFSSGSISYTINNWATSQTSNIFSNLSAGSYQIELKDETGCTTVIETITIENPDIGTPLFQSANLNSENCTSSVLNLNFSIPINCSTLSLTDFNISSITGATIPISEIICEGEYTNNLSLVISSALENGTYVVMVNPQNTNSILTKCLEFVENNSLTFSFSPISISSNQQNPSCNNFSDGEISISSLNNTGTVQYSIDGGSTVQSSTSFSNLPPGDYEIYIIDSEGCTDQASVTLDNPPAEDKALIAQLPDIDGCNSTSLSIQFSKPIKCNSVSPTDFNLTSSAGVEYTIVSVTCASSANFNTEYELTFSPTLTEGSYTLLVNPETENSVVDKCKLSATIASSDFNFHYRSPVSMEANAQDPSCNNFSDGEFTVITTNTTGSTQYSTDGGATLQNSSTFTDLPAGDYQIYSIDSEGCIANTSTSLINPEPEEQPQLLNVPDRADCEVSTITFSFTKPLECNTVSPNDFEIISDNGTIHTITEVVCENPNGLSHNFTLHISPTMQNGGYTLLSEAHTQNSLTDRCGLIAETSQNNFGVIVYNPPVITNTENTLLYEATITAESEQGELIFTISETGETNATGVFSGLKPGDYEVVCTDKNGCQDKTIITIDELILIIPTIFTPNNDGYNDSWRIEGIELIPDADIFIYDRWGKLLSQYKGSDPAWDATYGGKPVSSDTYWYVIKVTETFNYSGHTTVKR